jgi:hypothetical protein
MNANLIDKLDSLTQAERAAVVQLIDTLADERRSRDRRTMDAALAAARGSWPNRMSVEEIDAAVADLRDEWEGRL